jgi:N6-L-threonylcarbamoyladenine synthase
MLNSGDLEFSFSGLKTAVLTLVKKEGLENKADIAAGFQAAVVDVLAGKCLAALKQTGLKRLVVAGGVGANRALRARLDAEMAQRHLAVFYPPLDLCTDNGAMIAFAGGCGWRPCRRRTAASAVRPRWDLSELSRPALRMGLPMSSSASLGNISARDRRARMASTTREEKMLAGRSQPQ